MKIGTHILTVHIRTFCSRYNGFQLDEGEQYTIKHVISYEIYTNSQMHKVNWSVMCICVEYVFYLPTTEGAVYNCLHLLQ